MYSEIAPSFTTPTHSDALTDRGLDAGGIAEVIGCSRKTATAALRRQGITRVPEAVTADPTAASRLAPFRNVATVARLHGVTSKTARRWLLEAGLVE